MPKLETSAASSDTVYDRTAERERVQTVLRVSIPLAGLSAAVDFALAVTQREPWRLGAGLIPAAMVIVMLVCLRRINAGGIVSEAMLLFARASILGSIANALVFPEEYPAFEMVLLMAIIIVLPHIQGQRLRQFLLFAIPVGILMPIACLWLPLPRHGSLQSHRIMISVVLPFVFSLAMLLLSQFAERLRETITKVVSANRAFDEATAALRRETELLRVTLDSRKDAVLSLSDDEVLRYGNRAAYALFGLKANSTRMVQLSDFAQFSFSDKELTLATLVARAKKEGVAVAFPDGSYLLLEHGKRIPIAGTFTPLQSGSVLTVEDITEKLRLDAIRAARDAAEAAASARSVFLAHMSHELRTPMNGVIGMASLLADTPLSQEQQEFVETIRTSGAHLLNVINDILDFSKIDAGSMEIEHNEFNLRQCIEEAIGFTSPGAAQKRIELLLELGQDIPSQVFGDAGRLRQILLNLIGNAIKFTEQGEVVVSVRARRLENRRCEFRISVADTGIGIPADRMERLFRPFGQADVSSTRRYGGTGLGLVISKQLVERMGGAMTVDTDPGRGSTFSFAIVLETPVSTSDPTPAPTGRALEHRRILIVEDNAASRRILSSYCSGWGMNADSVETSAQALRLFAEQAFDIVLLDYSLPGLNGIELARQLAETQPGVPMVILSSLDMKLEESDSQLFAACLLKPIREAKLFDQLVSILNNKAKSARRVSGSTETAPRPKTGLRLLLVEDNPLNQRVAQLFLQKLGVCFDTATDGQEAVAAIRKQAYDVVVLDVQMPHMDGLEATRQIRAMYGAMNRPYIIGLTAHAFSSDRDEGLRAGMDDYMQKPLDFARLAAALERAEKVLVQKGSPGQVRTEG